MLAFLPVVRPSRPDDGKIPRNAPTVKRKNPLDGYFPHRYGLPMNRYATLLKQIEAFTARHGMSDTAFGVAAVNDSKIVPRIRSGKNITFRTFERLSEFMEQRDAA